MQQDIELHLQQDSIGYGSRPSQQVTHVFLGNVASTNPFVFLLLLKKRLHSAFVTPLPPRDLHFFIPMGCGSVDSVTAGAEQRGGQGEHSPSQRAVASACETCQGVSDGCQGVSALHSRHRVLGNSVVTEIRQISLVTASTCGGGHGMPNRQRQVPGKHKQQRACVLLHSVVRDERKGWDVRKRKREGRVALACWAAELSTALLLPHHLTPKILAVPKQLLTTSVQ